jgi:hypothetical protein
MKSCLSASGEVLRRNPLAVAPTTRSNGATKKASIIARTSLPESGLVKAPRPGFAMASSTATTARRWRALLAKADTTAEGGIGKPDLPLNVPTAEKSGAAKARTVPSLSSLVITGKELPEIGEAFKTGLTRKINVARRQPPENSPQRPPRQRSETTDFLRKTRATEALRPWPRRANPFALPRP